MAGVVGRVVGRSGRGDNKKNLSLISLLFKGRFS
jgi:hypothetical protein